MITPSVPNVAVQSALLVRVGYDSSQSVLELQFRDSAIYRYFAVPPDVVGQLLSSDSKGSFFNRHVRNCFRYTCLKPGR
jgi:KTSC domain